MTLDAMHTQTYTATTITGAGGRYVLTVKGNTPTLRRKLKALPWNDIPRTRSAAATVALSSPASAARPALTGSRAPPSGAA